ncbi:MAG TPA: apolipoprotein N-acyltransferase [Pyrinomonadaceae bacterium]|nr:apolipoprotein N-acyltransferase [Pyrinomonadaceae bacterium]
MRQVFSRAEWIAAGATALLLILSFPNFEFYPLAWIALVPLLVVIARHPSPRRAFLLGWLAGSVFFYTTCYWLTYSMIHYGGLPTVLAYLLLIPGAVVVGIFPGLFALVLALTLKKWGTWAVLLAPIFWTAFEWIRLGVTGQLWNALGYSQAYHWFLTQPARWGGVYAVSFLIVAVNSAVALLILGRTRWTVATTLAMILAVAFVIYISPGTFRYVDSFSLDGDLKIVAVQPNVPMTVVKSVGETNDLIERHFALSERGLQNLSDSRGPRLVIWPESPMNFSYSSDKALQERLAAFTKQNHTSLLFNSQEPAPGDGSYNSALLINEEGRLISQYDKIRLMPFGEYVPLPQWLPGASLISGIVGEFTPGDKYTLMPVGYSRAGVFICIESAYPWIARRLSSDGAQMLINISNDGYLGPTAVMRQHLANAIFRAAENGEPVLRVTNTGLTALIDDRGRVTDLTAAFQPDVRVWHEPVSSSSETFYTRHGDLFVQICTAITFMVLIAILISGRRSFGRLR